MICPPAWFPVTFPFSCNVFQFVRFLSASRPFLCKINCVIVIQWPRGIAPGKVVTEDGSSRVTSWLWQCVCAQLCPTPCDPVDCGHQAPLSKEFSSQEYWNGAHPQGIFPIQGSNPGLSQCKQILFHLSHQRSPKILEWVAYPFSRGNFLTQESNWGLLHYRWILYQLN